MAKLRKFLIVPLSFSWVAKLLGSIDSIYASQFVDVSWKDLLDHCNESTSTPEIQETVERIIHFINNVEYCWQMSIAEAMVTYKEKSSDEESSQVFIPFVISVQIGMMEGAGPTTSVDVDEQTVINLTVPGSSPPASTAEKTRENITPPSSPSISNALLGSSSATNTTVPLSGETMDLQLDYWTLSPKSDMTKKSETAKLTLKNTFRTLQVLRAFGQGDSAVSLTLSYVIKEKKQKIMRLGKKKEKEKEPDNRCQIVEGIHRLICSCRAPQAPLKVTIDGVEWSGVKFFQLTSQWQTHVKYFPVALFGLQERIP